MLNSLRTIRFRLTFWYIVLLTIIILAFSIYLQIQLQNSLSAQLDDGLQVAASQLLVNIDDSADPPAFRRISDNDVEQLAQARFAVRLVSEDGNVTDEVGNFPASALNVFDRPGFKTIEIDGTPWRIYTQRIKTHTRQLNVWLQMAQSLNVTYDARNNLFRLMVIGLPLTLIAAAFGGMFMANRALHPVTTIVQTVQTLDASDLTLRIEDDGPLDELGQLTQTLNSMLDRLQSAFDAERRFTADASHELRTPLTAIKGQIGVTLSRLRSVEEYENTLHHIEYETDRLIHMANDLLFLARLDATPQQWPSETINLTDMLDVVADQMRPIADMKQIALNLNISGSLSVLGVPDHLIRLFLNLLDNAIKYTHPNGQVYLTAQRTNDEIVVRVQDNGPGIASAHLPNLFKRFYRVQHDWSSNAGSTGLGLAIVYQITREHDGHIEVESTPGTGTTFILSLPAC